MEYDTTALDNPVWHALSTMHQQFALGNTVIRRYAPDVLPFFGCRDPQTDVLNEITPWLKGNEKLYLVGELPSLPSGWSVVNRLDCLQMMCPGYIAPAPRAPATITMLAEQDRPEMIALTNSVQPGFFKAGTPLLGRYFGIREQGKLVAMAGERMQMPLFTEISAVCTYPEFTGRGYAQQLVGHLCSLHHREGKLPVLHVLAANARAVGVYELLGFRVRREIPFWHLAFEGGR